MIDILLIVTLIVITICTCISTYHNYQDKKRQRVVARQWHSEIVTAASGRKYRVSTDGCQVYMDQIDSVSENKQ